jgi:hypothetical protein
VNSNFIRLTPDRQSKKGSIWSKKALMTPSFNAVMKFRISGQGKNMFGDGIALWIVQQSYYMEGNLHGFQDKFVGIGIIFDTFKNTETLHLHKDVTVLVNNGEKTFEMMTETPQGCDVDFRYHAARADFNIDSKSAVKIVVDGTSISVLMDAKGEGQYSQCVTINNHGLSADWLKKSHIGSRYRMRWNHNALLFIMLLYLLIFTYFACILFLFNMCMLSSHHCFDYFLYLFFFYRYFIHFSCSSCPSSPSFSSFYYNNKKESPPPLASSQTTTTSCPFPPIAMRRLWMQPNLRRKIAWPMSPSPALLTRRGYLILRTP